ALAGEVLEAFRIQCCAVAQGYARNDVFGTIVTRAADHSDIGDIGVSEQAFFYFSRVDIEATGEDGFFDARYQKDKAVFLHEADVYSAEPIAKEGFFGGFWLI